MRIAYTAIDQRGLSVSDVVESVSVEQAVESLRGDGLFVTDIQPATGKERVFRGSELIVPSESGAMRISELLFFTRQMAMLLRAGSPVVPALVSIGKQLKGSAKALVSKVRQDMESGRGLSEALKRFPGTFPTVYIAVVGAGEASANLPEMFSRLANWVNYKREIRNRVISAAIYPSLLIFLSVNIVITMVVFVVPRFKMLFESLGAKLPASTRIMFDISFFLRSQWGWFLVVGIACLAGAILYIRTARGKQWLANMQTRIPGLGRLFSRLLQAQMFRMMGLLLESRVGIMETLNLARQISINGDYQELNQAMRDQLQEGGRFSNGLAQSSMIAPSVAQAVLTGEDSGHLDQAMLFVADVLDDENTQMINTITKLFEPIILIGMGVVVGTIAMSLFLPLFDLAASAR